MARRIVEEDVTTPSTTVVDSDGSWVGRTIVALVVIALLVLGAIWLFNNVGDGDTGRDDVNVEIDGNTDGNDGDTENNTDGDNVENPLPQPS